MPMSKGPVEARIESKIDGAFRLAHLNVENESGSHNVPAGSESHFKVTLVAAEFSGQTLLQRHRSVNGVLADELSGPVHALSIHAYTEVEWRERFGEAPLSPPCLGGETPGGTE